MKNIYLILILSIFSLATLKATTYTSSQNGNWMNFTTWSPIGIPIPGDDIIINHIVALDTSFAYTSGSITVNTSGSLIQDVPVRDIWVNGTGASFTNDGTTTIRYLLLSVGSLTNTGTFNVKSFANYVTLNNSGSFNGVDSLYNNGTFNNNGTINVSTFYNDSIMNNYGNIWGLSTVVDSMFNAGTFLNDVGAILYADSCTNSNVFTNNGIINFDQFTNWVGTFTNNNYMSFGDMTNTGTFINTDSLVGGGSLTNTENLDNQAGAFIGIAISFLNVDTINNTATFTANGRMEIGDSFYNFKTITGTAPGSIQCADTSYNGGTMSGSFDFCDLTPPTSAPYIDFNIGTVAGTVTFCLYTSVNELFTDIMEIYPNPTKGMITINTEQPIHVELYNTLGRLVLQDQRNQINITNLENGIYLLRIKDSNGNLLVQEKIMKQ